MTTMPRAVNASEADRELRKKIAEGEEPQGTIFTRGAQFFLVPLGIVGVCVGIYFLFTWMAGGGPRKPKDVIQELRDGGAKARAQAALELAEILRRKKPEELKRDAAELVPKLIDAYQALPPDRPVSGALEAGAPMHIKILLVQSLGFIGDREAVPFLLEQATSGPEEVRPHAIDAIGGCGDPGVVPDLIKLLDSDSVDARKFAPRALGMLGDERAIEPLRKRLGDAHPDVQWNAACALGYYFRDPSGAPLLRQMLDRPRVAAVVKGDHAELKIANAMVTALNAVVALGDRGFVTQIEGVAKADPNPSVRHAANQALSRLK